MTTTAEYHQMMPQCWQYLAQIAILYNITQEEHTKLCAVCRKNTVQQILFPQKTINVAYGSISFYFIQTVQTANFSTIYHYFMCHFFCNFAVSQ